MGYHSICKVHGRSTVHVMLSLNGVCVKCIQQKVLYVPNQSSNFLPVGVLVRAGNFIRVDEGKFLIEKNVTIGAQDPRMKDLYVFQIIQKHRKTVMKWLLSITWANCTSPYPMYK